jgi:hypothetical protein
MINKYIVHEYVHKKKKKKKEKWKKNIKRFNQYIYQYNFGWSQCDEKSNSFWPPNIHNLK